MIAGYMTNGFGGLLDPEDRGPWLFCWSSGICLIPLILVALCWMSMRRALFARNTGEASGIALVQIVFWPGIVMGLILGNAQLDFRGALLLMITYAATLILFAWRARRVLLADFREAAANRYSHDRLSVARALLHKLSNLVRLRPTPCSGTTQVG
jgi:hypothetical protein